MERLNNLLDYKIIEISGHSVSIFQIILLVLILILVRLASRSIELLVKRRSEKYDLDEGKKFAIIKLFKYFLYIVAIILGLESLGFDITLLLAGSAALLVGIGLGVQDIFKDIISGILILFEGSIKVGDVIEIDELVGLVKEISIRTSKVRTRDGIIIIVPNSHFITQSVINWSNSNKLTRFKIDVGVAYGSDVRLVEKLLIECASNHEMVASRPKSFARFNNFGESSLEFQLYFWSDQIWRIENTKSEMRYSIDEAFRANGVTIPFPQRDLHIRSDATKGKSGGEE
ncbi:MAG: mechanosensitive ion channel [Vicingaceae bacterium]